MKLNVGCGGQKLEGYENLDIYPYPHVNCQFDLEKCSSERLPYADDTFEEMACIHTIEHITNVLPMMQELWRVAKPGCRITIACPYGSSDNADEDPTHVRRIYDNSFVYFSQCWYGRNDYGYRGDWELQTIMFRLKKKFFVDCQTAKQVQARIHGYRNVVDEFVAGLVAIKPARSPGFQPRAPKIQYSSV